MVVGLLSGGSSAQSEEAMSPFKRLETTKVVLLCVCVLRKRAR